MGLPGGCIVSKWNLIVDVAECHNCNNCFLACKDEYIGNDIPGYSAPQPLHGHKWIDILTKERGRIPMVDAAHVPVMCNHCDDAPCVAAGRGAVKKRADGIVLIDPQEAAGRKDLVAACPYGAIWWNEELNLPQAWTFDAHLLDRGWQAPRCVQSCPTGAMKSLKLADPEMAERARREGLEPLKPELGTKPRVYYKNLHRYTKLFVGGVILGEHDGIIDCVAQASAELVKDGRVLCTGASDAFGEFKFDGLEPKSGAYEVRIIHPGYIPATLPIDLCEESLVLTDIRLQLA
jgi:Fe-S-cluster-containing dehydrogenase component